MELNDYELDIKPPTLYEVLQVARDSGLVGESDTVLTLVLAMVRGHLVVMTGPSRAGKDVCVDAAEEVYNSDEMVYRWPVDDSETAAYYNRDQINQYPVHRFPDLARLEEHHEKILKAFGEGRDAERNRTDMAAEKAGNDAVEDQVLECPHTVIAFIASDNENVNLDDFPELRNRALTLPVDASEAQTSRVNKRKAQERAGELSKNVDAIRKAQIQDYHSQIPVEEWTESPQNKIINPAAVEIHDQKPIPELFPEARQDFDRLLEFMETAALYHFGERLIVDNDGSRQMFVTPVDVWEAMTVIGNKMVMSALNLSKEDRTILELLDESNKNLTKADIQQSLRTQGFHITDRDVKRSLDSLVGKGYVRMFQGNPNEYTFNEFGQVIHHDAGIDYEGVVDAAMDNIYNVAPQDAADRYVEEFCTGDGLITTHPFTGEAVDILEVDELDEMISEGVQAVEEVFEDESTSDEEDEQQTQGTLM
jgi:Fe2+ or Zn2+ uptake regulation protein